MYRCLSRVSLVRFPASEGTVLTFIRIVPFVLLVNERYALHQLSDWITYDLFSRFYWTNCIIFTFNYSYYIYMHK